MGPSPSHLRISGTGVNKVRLRPPKLHPPWTLGTGADGANPCLPGDPEGPV